MLFLSTLDKTVLTRSHAFSRASHQLHVIISNVDWFIVLFVSFEIGYSGYFGFGFAILN